MKYLIGTRGSKLALAQVDHVAGLLKRRFPEFEFEKVIIKTTGDKLIDAPLAKIGGKGLFVKEIDEAVVRGGVDFAVHSMKDVPTEMLPDLEITCVPEREDDNDALISRSGLYFDDLPKGSVIGSSSLRRKAQVLSRRPDLVLKDMRGNVDTRLRKLRAGEYDAIIMAKAGLKRLGFAGEITQELPVETFLPAVGQGAIAVVAREYFAGKNQLAKIHHKKSEIRVKAERALLKRLGGGCQVPLGAYTRVDNGLTIKAAMFSPDGKEKIEASRVGDVSDAEALGRAVAEELLGRGGERLLKKVYGQASY